MLRVLCLLCYLCSLMECSQQPKIQRIPNVANVPIPRLKWPPAPRYHDTVIEFIKSANLSECEDQCFKYTPPNTVSPVSGWTQCLTYTYFKNTGRCVGIVDHETWEPTNDDAATTGRITWPPQPCDNDASCSYNGVCAADKDHDNNDQVDDNTCTVQWYPHVMVHDLHPSVDMMNVGNITTNECADVCCATKGCVAFVHIGDQAAPSGNCSEPNGACCWLKPTVNMSRLHAPCSSCTSGILQRASLTGDRYHRSTFRLRGDDRFCRCKSEWEGDRCQTLRLLPTRDQDCPSCPNLDFWCGKTWQDANTRCHTPCPRCQDPWCATCADGEQCFASCTSCAPPVPPPGPAVCGGRRCPGKGAYCCGQIDDSALCVNPAANQTCCRTAAASDAPRVCSGNQQCCAGQSFGSGATCCGKNQSCEFHVGGMPTCSSAAAE